MLRSYLEVGSCPSPFIPFLNSFPFALFWCHFVLGRLPSFLFCELGIGGGDVAGRRHGLMLRFQRVALAPSSAALCWTAQCAPVHRPCGDTNPSAEWWFWV